MNFVYGIPCKPKYLPAEPDGSQCLYCGDEIYLNAFEVELYHTFNGSYQGTLKGLLCGGCGEEFVKLQKEIRNPPQVDENGIPDFF